MAIKLYHVSFELSESLHKEFIPKIPDNTIRGENEEIPRICFSDSIQGCIRGIKGYPKMDSPYAEIIVWEHEFLESDNLYDWRYLYENNLVPDAAVTHEYWFTERITLDGSKYRISDIEHRVLYSFPMKYKEEILQILSDYVEDLTIFENIDPCTIINEWVPEHLDSFDVMDIIERMKEAVSYEEETQESEELWKSVFGGGDRRTVSRIPDYDPTDMLVSYVISKV